MPCIGPGTTNFGDLLGTINRIVGAFTNPKTSTFVDHPSIIHIKKKPGTLF
jgi:hypothetical protein